MLKEFSRLVNSFSLLKITQASSSASSFINSISHKNVVIGSKRSLSLESCPTGNNADRTILNVAKNAPISMGFNNPTVRRRFHCSPLAMSILQKLHQRGKPKHKKCSRDKKPITGFNHLRGTVLKVVIRHPKKPNSGNRKCAIVKLSNGREACAHIPGEAHNLQEHSQVLVRGGRRRDLIGVKCIVKRGKLDCAPYKNPKKQQGFNAKTKKRKKFEAEIAEQWAAALAKEQESN